MTSNEEFLIKQWEREEQERKNVEQVKWLLVAVTILFILCGVGIFGAKAHAYTQEQAIKAVIGEAEGEPQMGKDAIACSIAYRGSLRGVYGLTSQRVINHRYSLKTYIQAKRAVESSRDQEYCESLVHGATFWEGTEFKTPYWATNMKITAVIGHQKFYKEAI